MSTDSSFRARVLRLTYIVGLGVISLGLIPAYFVPVTAKNVAATKLQGTERIVRTTHIFGSPIELIDVKIAGKSIKDREKVTLRRQIAELREMRFDGGDNWLKDATFTFKNVSGKPIVAIWAEFIARHPRREHPLGLTLTPSRRVPHFLNKGMRDTETLLPNEELTYSVEPSVINRIDERLKAVGASASEVSLIELDFGRIQFDYNSGWNKGTFFRRDLNNPEIWVPTTQGSEVKNIYFKKTSLSLKTTPVMKAGVTSSTLYQGCNSSSNDLTVYCFIEGTFFQCQANDEGVNTSQFGSYYLEFREVDCVGYGPGHSCGGQMTWVNRRRLNLNCSV